MGKRRKNLNKKVETKRTHLKKPKTHTERFERNLIKAKLTLPTGLLVATTQDSEDDEIHICLLQHNIVKLRPNNVKVKMIESLISKKECAFMIKSAEEYASANGGWTSSRHTNYATTDIPVDCIFGENNHVDDIVNDIVFPQLAAYFNLNVHNLQIGELFIAKYEFNVCCQSGLLAHADGTPWSFVIALNDPAEFTGGGTHFMDSDTTVRPNGVGDVALFCGKNVHEGVGVTNGIRYIMAGFCNYMSPDVSHEYYLSNHDKWYDGSAGLAVQTGDLIRGVYLSSHSDSPDGVEYLANGSDIHAMLHKGLKCEGKDQQMSVSVLVERMETDGIDLNQEDDDAEYGMAPNDALILDMIRNVDQFVTTGEFWSMDKILQ